MTVLVPQRVMLGGGDFQGEGAVTSRVQVGTGEESEGIEAPNAGPDRLETTPTPKYNTHGTWICTCGTPARVSEPFIKRLSPGTSRKLFRAQPLPCTSISEMFSFLNLASSHDNRFGQRSARAESLCLILDPLVLRNIFFSEFCI